MQPLTHMVKMRLIEGPENSVNSPMYSNYIFNNWRSKGPVNILITMISVAIGAFGAFLLGVFSLVPRPFWGTFDEGTFLFLAGSITFIATVTWTSFKLSRPIILSMYQIGIFLYCKFVLSLNYPGGIRNPKITKFQSYKFRRFLKSNNGVVRTLISQIIVTIALLWKLFFSSAADGDLGYLYALLFVTLFYTVAVFAAHGVLISISSHRDFFMTNQGLGLLATLSLVLCFTAGALRVSDMMSRQPLSLHTRNWVCLITPIFPVSSGELVFLQETRSFAIIRNDGGVMTFQLENNLEQLTPCWKK